MRKKMDENTVEKIAQKNREEASKFASMRLSRGSLRIQSGAFATSSEWDERRASQPSRMARLNQKLK